MFPHNKSAMGDGRFVDSCCWRVNRCDMAHRYLDSKTHRTFHHHLLETDMNLSDNGFKKLIEWEGFKSHVYKDSAGLPTIGVGHLLTQDELRSGKLSIRGVDTRYANGLSNVQIEDLFKQDLASREQLVRTLVQVPVNQNQFDVLVSLAFNIGRVAFQKSTLLKRLNSGRYEEVPAQLRRWVYSGGELVNGLVNRRENEIALWNTKPNDIDRRIKGSQMNVAATLEWLIKRNQIKLFGETASGQKITVSYDDHHNQFRINK